MLFQFINQIKSIYVKGFITREKEREELRSTHIWAGSIEESIRNHTITNGTSHKGEPVKDQRGFMGILEE